MAGASRSISFSRACCSADFTRCSRPACRCRPGVMRFVNIAHGDFIVLACFVLLSLTTIARPQPGHRHADRPAARLAVRLRAAALSAAARRRRERAARHSRHLRPVDHHRERPAGRLWRRSRKRSPAAGWRRRRSRSGMASMSACSRSSRLSPRRARSAALDLLLYRTGIGAKIRAVSDDVAAADLIGLSSVRIYAVAMGISFVTIAHRRRLHVDLDQFRSRPPARRAC